MNLDTIVQGGSAPWEPSAQATNLDVWGWADTPVIGTFEVGGHRVLFNQLIETENDATVWCYIPLTLDDDRRLDGPFDSEADLYEACNNLAAGREIVVAWVREFCIRKFGPVRAEASALDAASSFLDALIEVEERAAEDLERRLRERLKSPRRQPTQDDLARELVSYSLNRPTYAAEHVQAESPLSLQDRAHAVEALV